jgi:hypothetical protein
MKFKRYYAYVHNGVMIVSDKKPVNFNNAEIKREYTTPNHDLARNELLVRNLFKQFVESLKF